MRRLPESWEWARFKEVATVEANLVNPADYPDYPHVAPNHIETRTGKLLPHTTVRDDGVTSSKHLFFPGHILYSKIRPYLAKVVRVEFSGLCSADMYPVTTELHTPFLHHWLLSPQFTVLAAGEQGRSLLPKINRDALDKLPVPVPPIREQRRIVAAIEEHLSRLNAAESALNSARRRLATFRGATTSETLRGDWPMVRLRDHTIDQRYGSSSKAGREGAVPVLRMGNIIDGHLDYTDLKYLPDGHPDLETCTLEPGDLLFNRTNSPELVGKSAVFEGWATPVTFASYLIRVRLDDELDAHWVSTAINGPAGRRYIETVRTQQVGQANVNGTKLKDFPVPMPSIDVQRERLAQLDLARTWFRAVESEIHRALMRALALRRSILAAAFSGKLVPQDSDDEPASVLLGRIRDQRALPIPSRPARAHAVSP